MEGENNGTWGEGKEGKGQKRGHKEETAQEMEIQNPVLTWWPDSDGVNLDSTYFLFHQVMRMLRYDTHLSRNTSQSLFSSLAQWQYHLFKKVS